MKQFAAILSVMFTFILTFVETSGRVRYWAQYRLNKARNNTKNASSNKSSASTGNNTSSSLTSSSAKNSSFPDYNNIISVLNHTHSNILKHILKEKAALEKSKDISLDHSTRKKRKELLVNSMMRMYFKGILNITESKANKTYEVIYKFVKEKKEREAGKFRLDLIKTYKIKLGKVIDTLMKNLFLDLKKDTITNNNHYQELNFIINRMKILRKRILGTLDGQTQIEHSRQYLNKARKERILANLKKRRLTYNGLFKAGKLSLTTVKRKRELNKPGVKVKEILENGLTDVYDSDSPLMNLEELSEVLRLVKTIKEDKTITPDSFLKTLIERLLGEIRKQIHLEAKNESNERKEKNEDPKVVITKESHLNEYSLPSLNPDEKVVIHKNKNKNTELVSNDDLENRSSRANDEEFLDSLSKVLHIVTRMKMDSTTLKEIDKVMKIAEKAENRKLRKVSEVEHKNQDTDDEYQDEMEEVEKESEESESDGEDDGDKGSKSKEDKDSKGGSKDEEKKGNSTNTKTEKDSKDEDDVDEEELDKKLNKNKKPCDKKAKQSKKEELQRESVKLGYTSKVDQLSTDDKRELIAEIASLDITCEVYAYNQYRKILMESQ